MMNETNYLESVKNGEMFLSDGTQKSIPHWGDPAWTHLFCVRHAEKDRATMANPNLSALGQARAERLGRMLSEAALDLVYTTDFLRTRQTAEPSVRRAHTLPMITYDPREQNEWIESLIADHPGKKCLIVGHQDNIPMLINHLKGEGFGFDYIEDFEFGHFYVVATQAVAQSEILELRY